MSKFLTQFTAVPDPGESNPGPIMVETLGHKTLQELVEPIERDAYERRKKKEAAQALILETLKPTSSHSYETYGADQDHKVKDFGPGPLDNDADFADVTAFKANHEELMAQFASAAAKKEGPLPQTRPSNGPSTQSPLSAPVDGVKDAV